MKKILVFLAIAITTSLLFAVEVNINVGGKDEKFDVPIDVANLVNKNKSQIEDALRQYNVSKNDIDKAVTELNKVYYDILDEFGTLTPVTDVENGLNNFSKDLAPAISNTQLMQNVWAEAWLGKLVPGFHLGAGIDLGASQMKITALKDTAKALGFDEVSDLPDSFAFPTVAGDVRLGVILLPFDIGASFMTIDSSRINALDEAISPMAFDFFTVGFDFRWAILQGKTWQPKFSVGAGYVFTKGGVDISSDEADANLNFKNHTAYLQAQLSKKLLFFIPYIGAKVAYTKSEVNWSATANWSSILDGDAGELKKLEDWKILPAEFSGGYDGWKIIPQVYGGFALDFAILNLTFGVGWDFVDKLASGAVNIRLAW
ncbi:MAG: hypothetical protein K2F89_08655 [Treponemataceae bacterium]|nr:hypothetical protein [Treponemataceae bacterium]